MRAPVAMALAFVPAGALLAAICAVSSIDHGRQLRDRPLTIVIQPIPGVDGGGECNVYMRPRTVCVGWTWSQP